MAKIKKVTKVIADAISEEMTEAKFGERKKKYQKDLDDYVTELLQRHIPLDLRNALELYDSFIKKTSIVMFRREGDKKSPAKTIVCARLFPYLMPIEITTREYETLLELDGARWDYASCAQTYKGKLEKLLYELAIPEVIVDRIPYSKDYVAKYFPTIENELDNLNTLAEKA